MGASRGNESMVLDSVFSGMQPLGPASIDRNTTRDQAAVLFDGDNEVESIIRRSSPVFLIGRRGAGKTAFLRASAHSGAINADLFSPELVGQMAKTISDLGIDTSGEFTERIVPLWEACFTAALCSKVWSSHCLLEEPDCPDAFRFGRIDRKPRLGGRATVAATNVLLAIRKASQDDYASVDSLVDEVELNGVPLWRARLQLENAAQQSGCSAIISMDSLDQYQGVFYRYGSLLSDASLAFQGLFRAVSRIGRDQNSFFKVRVSFPAELWHYFSGLSANPLKDFDNNVLLHWDNRELLNLCATRFLKYLRVNFPSRYRNLDASATSGRNLYEYFYDFLPRIIPNSLGINEPTLPYLIRHTQLLPRHLIHIFNLVFADQDLSTTRLISAAHIRSAVADAEKEITNTVISAFDQIYPELRTVCEELIRHLPMKIVEGDLHRIMNQHKRHGVDYPDALQMLIEAGVLGRYVGSTLEYDKADFEYLHVHRMFVTQNDTLCLHPIFARTFNSPDSEASSRNEMQLPIMPLGSDPGISGDFRRYVRVTSES